MAVAASMGIKSSPGIRTGPMVWKNGGRKNGGWLTFANLPRIVASRSQFERRSREVFRIATLDRIHMGSFEDLYHQHVGAVFRFAMSVAGKKETAEDLTSEAFLALHRNLDSIDESLLPGWLLTVVRNRARDLWRHRVVEERYREQFRDPPTAPPPALERWILDTGDLKPIHRACVMLRYVHGMTRAEIADRTGLSETQVKGHLQYALALLRKTYGVAR
jgi:RNA polymerase sigma-70 factor, ECF subfamily